MSKCDFNKVALLLYSNHTSEWVFTCKSVAYFWNTYGGLLLNLSQELDQFIKCYALILYNLLSGKSWEI